jgi:hypothetical protein
MLKIQPILFAFLNSWLKSGHIPTTKYVTKYVVACGLGLSHQTDLHQHADDRVQN